MSMTREETISILEESKRQNEIMRDNPSTFWASHQMAEGVKNAKRRIEAFEIALSALRPVSRELVEKVWPGCHMCKGWNTIELKPCANGDLGVQADIGSSGQADPFGLVVYNKLLASGYIDFKFCPFCGSPKTAEAVQMVMERINKMEETGNEIG